LRIAATVSRAMTLDPMAAWTAISNIWRGISPEAMNQLAADRLGSIAVHDDGQRVDRLAGDEHVDLDQVGGAVAASS
jgi:hypothetical protein